MNESVQTIKSSDASKVIKYDPHTTLYIMQVNLTKVGSTPVQFIGKYTDDLSDSTNTNSFACISAADYSSAIGASSNGMYYVSYLGATYRAIDFGDNEGTVDVIGVS